MGGGKKTKSASRGKDRKDRKDSRSAQQAQSHDDTGFGGHDAWGDGGQFAGLSIQEKVRNAQPFWESLDGEQRREILSIPLAELEQDIRDLGERDEELAAELREKLAHGLARLAKHNTWKAWRAWEGLGAPAGANTAAAAAGSTTDLEDPAAAAGDKAPSSSSPSSSSSVVEFFDGEEFRKYLQSQYPADIRDMLARRDWSSKVETPAETALRTRMQVLLSQVHNNTMPPQEEAGGANGANGQGALGDGDPRGGGRTGGDGGRNKRGGFDGRNGGHHGGRNGHHTRHPVQDNASSIRGNNVDLITVMLESLEQEHELLYHAFLFPVTEFVCARLPANARESSREELFFEDLEKLPVEDVTRISEFLTEKIDGLSARMKPDPNEEDTDDEEGMGDVDLLQLEEGGGKERRKATRGSNSKGKF